MPRKPCYWTRKLELDLVSSCVREITYGGQLGIQKYEAYAEFAARLGRRFTARSVRDHWVKIRSTFNHNNRRVERSKLKADSVADVYELCWPLWNPLQFLKDICKKDDYENFDLEPDDYKDLSTRLNVKEEQNSELENDFEINIHQHRQ